jgi:type II secretory pathway pseudopilin PulG
MKPSLQLTKAFSVDSLQQAAHLRSRRSRGLSLIELVGAIAIMAIVAAAMVPPLVRSLDQGVLTKERKDLEACSDALMRSIQRNRIVPASSTTTPSQDWGNVIAAELGVEVSAVTNNTRGIPRAFIIDPAFNIGVNTFGPPYVQGMSGSYITNTPASLPIIVMPPPNPRMILISSISKNLPSLNTFPAANDFNSVWNAANNTVPSGPAWTGWGGRGEDLVIQRINLSSLFVHLILFNYPAPTAPAGAYSLDRLTPCFVPNTALGTNIYIIKNTVLGLYDKDGTTLKSEQIINQNSTFVFDNGVWRNSIFNVASPAGQDSASIASMFMAAKWNPNATSGTKQSDVVVAAMQYMEAYDAYASSGFTAATKTTAQAKQTAMMTAVNNLISGLVEGQCQ